MEDKEQKTSTKMEPLPPSQNRGFLTSNAPAYNLLDHPEFYMLGPSNTNQGFPNTNPEREARRVLDSYSGRSHYTENDEEATRNSSYRSYQRSTSDPYASSAPPPPYFDGATVLNNEMESETQPLLGHRNRRNSSLGGSSSEDTIDDSGFDYQNVNVGMASFWAIVAGISFSGCRILMQNLKLNTIEVTLVGAFVQIVLSGIFVSFCQCHRLWPSSPAGNRHKVFLVLYAFLYGILALCTIFVFDLLDQFDAETLISFTIVTTPIWSLFVLKEPVRIWKLLFVPVMFASIVVIAKPPAFWNIIDPPPTPHPKPHLLTYIQEDEKFTTGVMAGVVGVAIIGGLANTAIAATGKSVSNGTLIFYAGFASFLIGVLASRADHTQRILTPDIINIPFIDWIIMNSHAFMTVCGTAFFMNSVKASTPTIAIVLTKLTYIAILYSANCILLQQIPDMLSIIGLVTLFFSALCLASEFALHRRLPNCLKTCF